MAAYAPRRYSDPKYVGFAVLQPGQQAAHPHATYYATAAYTAPVAALTIRQYLAKPAYQPVAEGSAIMCVYVVGWHALLPRRKGRPETQRLRGW